MKKNGILFRVASGLLAAALTLSLTACGGSSSNSDASAAADSGATHLRLIYSPSLCAAPMYIAIENGYFEDEGLDIEQVTVDAAHVSEAIGADQVDVGMGLIGKMLQPLENGLPIKFTTGLHTGAAPYLALVGLCWLDAGSRCFYATKPLNTVEDFKNVKFRVMQSSIYQDTVSALGAIPISMSGSEVYSALQTGLVDGAENNIPRIIDMSHNELCKYLILDRHNIMPEMVIVSASTWNRLDEADRTILKECAANLQANMIAAWGETEQAALDTLAAGGMIITEPDAELLTALREAEQPVYDQYGAAYADLVEQIENIQY